MEYEISVIIPTHNNEKTIERSIRSILSQSFSFPFEVVVILDNCTDKTPEAVSKLSLENPNIHAYPSSCGSANLARLEGIRKACGKYLMFLDGDDYYHVDALRIMHERIEREEADIVNCNLYYVRKNGPRKAHLRAEATYDQEKAMGALFRDLSFKGFLYTKIFKAELFQSLNLSLPKANNLYEDALLIFYYLTLAKKAINIRDCLVYYDKTNENSLTSTESDRLQGNINVRAKVREELDKRGLEGALKQFRKYSLRPKTLLIADLFLTKFASKQEKKEKEKQAKEDIRRIFGKERMPVEGMSYSSYLKEVKSD